MKFFEFLLDEPTDVTRAETATEKWLVCTSAIWSMYRGGDWQCFAGAQTKSQREIDAMGLMLRRDWGINNKAELLDTVKYLKEPYTNKQNLAKEFIAVGGWDLCRACQILAMSFVGGLISRKEMVTHSIAVGQIIQRLYHSWDELYDSYLKGYKDWRRGFGGDWQSELAARENFCRQLKNAPDGPRSLNWNTKLRQLPWQHLMRKSVIIPVVSVVAALFVAAVFFVSWTPDFLSLSKEPPVTQSDISKNKIRNYAGYPAGPDIPRLNGAADFAKMPYSTGYATAQPTAIVPTNIYRLKPWVNPYETKTYKGRRLSSTGQRKPAIRQSDLPFLEDYSQYYLLQLPDKSYILAQLPPADAAAAAKGTGAALPLGKKTGLTATARKYLTPICQQYNVKTNGGVFYAFNDQWEKENYFTSFLLRLAAAAVLWLALTVGFMQLGSMLFQTKKSTR